MSDIEKADSVVGITGTMKESLATDAVKNTYRRGAYCEWLREHPAKQGPLTVDNTLEELAAEVVRIDAEGRPKPPDDGLPPGPWTVATFRSGASRIESVKDGKVVAVAYVYEGGRTEHADYLARCGSPVVRRLLAAFEVTDKATGPMSRTLVITPGGNTNTGFGLVESHDPICWLTPRATP